MESKGFIYRYEKVHITFKLIEFILILCFILLPVSTKQ